MAINPESAFPGKITASSAEYPFGKARNITVPGDGTGTPWDQLVLNDIFGFQQALLSEAGTVPTGAPDEVGASQYLAALQSIVVAPFDTVADMTAVLKASLKDNQQISVGGYNTIGDGGGGAFFFDKDDNTSVVDNGTVFLTDGGGIGRWKRIIDDFITDVMFGVVGDGIVDDTARMQAYFDFIVAAAANEGTAWLFSATPKITSTVSVDITSSSLGFIIKGDGRVTIESEVIGEPTFEIQNAIFFKMDGVSFEGNGLTGASGNGHAIALTDTAFGSGTFFPQQVDIDNCFITGFKGNDIEDEGGTAIRADGIYVSNGLVVHIDRTAITNCGVGIRFNKTQNCSVTRSVIDGCDLYGIHLKNTKDGNLISNTEIINCGRDNGSFSSTVDGLTVPNAGILIEQVSSIVTIENSCKLKNNISQISATFSPLIKIDGNFIRPEDKTSNNGNSGIWMSNCHQVDISNNEFEYVVSGSSTYTAVELMTGENTGDFVFNFDGNLFLHGDTVDQDILIDGNGSSNDVTLGINGNRFGDNARPGDPQTTDCIKIQNARISGSIERNLFIAGNTTTTITDALDIATGVNLLDISIKNNTNRESGTGTITNPILLTENASATADTTNGSGDITVTHGLIKNPASLLATSAETGSLQSLACHSVTSTEFKIRFRDASGAAITATPVTPRWRVSV